MKGKILASVLVASVACLPHVVLAKDKGNHGHNKGGYVAGDFHNHTVFTDGSTSIQRITDEAVATYGLGWFIQSGHGGG